jgi:AAA domain-containing protein
VSSKQFGESSDSARVRVLSPPAGDEGVEMVDCGDDAGTATKRRVDLVPVGDAVMPPPLPTDSDLLAMGINPDDFERVLTFERTTRVVRRIVDAEEQPVTPIPPLVSLADRLLIERPPARYRIEGWFGEGHHGLLVAQYKSGKTTTLGNLVRSLVDGDLFLGKWQVTPADSIAMLDFEMDERQIEGWLRDQKIRNAHHVHLVSLRGAASSFNILDPACRRDWATRLRGKAIEFLTFDCLRPAMDALGLNEHSEVGVFLTAFDELLKDAAISEALIVHHSGHTGDRSRGDSRTLDWPDVIWNLVRADRDDLNSPRFITAKGRDISVEEGELKFDPLTRHLTYVPTSRKKASADKVMRAVVYEVSRSSDPVSIREMQAMLAGRFTKRSVESALKQASDGKVGYLSRVKGPKGSYLHAITAAGQGFLDALNNSQNPEEI